MCIGVCGIDLSQIYVCHTWPVRVLMRKKVKLHTHTHTQWRMWSLWTDILWGRVVRRSALLNPDPGDRPLYTFYISLLSNTPGSEQQLIRRELQELNKVRTKTEVHWCWFLKNPSWESYMFGTTWGWVNNGRIFVFCFFWLKFEYYLRNSILPRSKLCWFYLLDHTLDYFSSLSMSYHPSCTLFPTASLSLSIYNSPLTIRVSLTLRWR